jgi:succinyl-CoA synthetase beta subunit
MRAYQGIDLARRTDLPSSMRARVGSVAASLYRVFVKYDCRTIEINPLVVTSQGAVVAADCRMAIDDNALFRHPDLDITLTHEMDREPTLFDEIAWSIDQMDPRGTGYVAQMQQSIDAVATVGYHGIGGGGAILGVDALNRAGLRVANYADTSGNPTAAKVYRVARLILSQPGIDGYCLGGFVVANQEQWHHAHGIVKALREELAARPGFPVLLLLCGNGEEEALRILREGLSDLPGRIEIHGRRQVWDTDFIAGRMRALIDEYQAKRRAPEGGVL